MCSTLVHLVFNYVTVSEWKMVIEELLKTCNLKIEEGKEEFNVLIFHCYSIRMKEKRKEKWCRIKTCVIEELKEGKRYFIN